MTLIALPVTESAEVAPDSPVEDRESVLLGHASPDTGADRHVATRRRVVLVVEYDGTTYHGFQLQSGHPTVQEELETAIWRLTGEHTRVTAASRTDAGVHALGQIVSFRSSSRLPPHKLVAGLNHYLPTAIAVKAAYRPGRDFHVQRRAISRQYEYHILNSPTRSPLCEGRAWLVSAPLDTTLMQEACQALIGVHDFASFTSGTAGVTRDTVRRIYRADVRRDGDRVIFTIVANSFLTHQVRHTVGALVSVGLGRMSISDFCSIMERKQPGLAGPKAPAAGLYLVSVNYPCSIEEKTHEDI